jgi:signal transduction histidine kinase
MHVRPGVPSEVAEEVRDRLGEGWQLASFRRVPHAYLFTDHLGLIRDANAAAAVLLDQPRAALLDKPLAVFLPSDQRVAFHAQLARMRALRRVIECELLLRGRDRQWEPVVAAVGPVRDDHGRLLGLAWILNEAGERHRLLHEVVQATERERSRLAAELHDDSLQHLAALGLRLGQARLRLASGEPESVAELLSRCESDLARQLASLRRLVSGLRPPVLDDRGLPAALNELLTGIERDTGAAASLQVRLADRLPREVETVLYRVAQEALANVVTHAGARHVMALLSDASGGLVLRVVDDGKGFDPGDIGAYVRDGRFGLVGMRQRVEMLGGTWRVRSEPGNGTAITVRLPLPAGRARASASGEAAGAPRRAERRGAGVAG